MRWTGQIFWLLAYGARSFETRTFFPPSPPEAFGRLALGSRIQLQQRNCSRFARDFLRRSTVKLQRFQARKELDLEVAACASPLKTYLINRPQLARRAVA